jgi:hypothetical protein
VVVSLVIIEADRPAPLPKNPSSAGTKSLLLSPCGYSRGSASVTFAERRHHGGSSDDRNRHRCPVAWSTRRSSTRGAATSMAPAAVVTCRGRAWPLRTTNRRPASSRTLANAEM